jgi:2-polyprenyl-3-methyl-5-hydroxy-6-metoxy-1,4-benzoquinol methylase
VRKLCDQLKTTSVLDYGCGKGMLARELPFPIYEYDPAVPGKDGLPRAADIVTCTDVLEHIEPDHLQAVVMHLASVTKKVLYAVIHTGPAQKTLADGRNAHLIQQGEPFWRAALAPFFDVAQCFIKGPELYIVAAPKRGKAAA